MSKTSFRLELELALTEEIKRRIVGIGTVSACAGIVGDPDLQFKARVNHYGSFTWTGINDGTKGLIPARPFITRGVKVWGEGKRAIKEAVEKELVFDKSGEKRAKGFRRYVWDGEPVGLYYDPYWYNNIAQVMKRIADQMKENQQHTIQGSVGLIKNAPQTEAKKGKNWPLVDTGALLNGIRSWVEVNG